MASQTLTLAQLYNLKAAGHVWITGADGSHHQIDQLIADPTLRTVDSTSTVSGGEPSVKYGGNKASSNPTIGDFFGNTQSSDPTSQASQAAGGTPSYLNSSGSNMNWNTLAQNLGLSAADISSFQQSGFTPDQVMQSYQTTGKFPSATQAAAATPQQNAFGITSKDSGKGYQTLTANNGQTINVDAAGNYFTTDASGNNTPVSDAQAQSMGFQSTNPETQAIKQMGQIDPNTEALRQQLSGSYQDQLTQGANPPSAAQLQSYLDTYKQIDPAGFQQRSDMTGQTAGQVTAAQSALQQANDYVTKVTGNAPTSAADALSKYQQLDPQGYANMQQLGTSMGSYLKSADDQLALGSQLDPTTQMQVEQQARKGQADRGNLYGSGQAAVEAMTTGQAGQALLQQRQAAEQAATGSMQSYLTSGATTGAVGNALYQQGLGNQQNAFGTQQNALGGVQNALGAQGNWLGSGQSIGSLAGSLYQQGLQNRANAQQSALSYLGSGQTPYQAGASYLNNAEGAAANSAQGGPVYNPTSLGQGTLGTSQQAPQYGLDIGAQSQNYFNSLNNAYGGGAAGSTKNKAVSAGTGALSGAMAGATAGSVVPGYGTAIGAVVGGVAGGLGGYYS